VEESNKNVYVGVQHSILFCINSSQENHQGVGITLFITISGFLQTANSNKFKMKDKTTKKNLQVG